ncbi:hypothetical protein JVU11DRAFT_289 [Chiua virens]|nr:hypothetical protein JVU11DRAFT_289 [Chiua virens]
MAHQQYFWGSYGGAYSATTEDQPGTMTLDASSDLASHSHVSPSNAPYAPYQISSAYENYATVPSANGYHDPVAQSRIVLLQDSEETNHATVVQLVPYANGSHGPGAQSGVVYEVQLLPDSEGMASVTTPTTQALCTGICQYPNNSGVGICGFRLTCQTRDISAHFKFAHGVKNINESEKVVCMWRQCFLKSSRKNLIRHIREHHLDHSRTWGCSTN